MKDYVLIFILGLTLILSTLTGSLVIFRDSAFADHRLNKTSEIRDEPQSIQTTQES